MTTTLMNLPKRPKLNEHKKPTPIFTTTPILTTYLPPSRVCAYSGVEDIHRVAPHAHQHARQRWLKAALHRAKGKRLLRYHSHLARALVSHLVRRCRSRDSWMGSRRGQLRLGSAETAEQVLPEGFRRVEAAAAERTGVCGQRWRYRTRWLVRRLLVGFLRCPAPASRLSSRQ